MENNLLSLYLYFGISVGESELLPVDIGKYHDLEKFFLDNTAYEHSSRTLEGFLTWRKIYGFLLSPSKIRRMVNKGYPCYKPALGAFLNFIEKYHSINFSIVSELCWPEPAQRSFIRNVPLQLMKKKNLIFEVWGLIIPDFELEESKYLLSNSQVMNQCLELKNRIVMGSVLHSDLASYLGKLSTETKPTKYKIAKEIYNLSGSVGKAPIILLEGY